MSQSPDFVCVFVAIIAFNSPREGAHVSHAVLQLWWVELNIGTSDPASWRTNTFCTPSIDSSIFCQILNLLRTHQNKLCRETQEIGTDENKGNALLFLQFL